MCKSLQKWLAAIALVTWLSIVLSLLAACSSLTIKQKGELALKPKAICGTLNCPPPTSKLASDGKLKLIIEDEFMFEIFSNEINKRAAKSGLSDLKTTVLPDGDFELRVWSLPSFLPVKGFVLRRANEQWNALLLRPLGKDETDNPTSICPQPSYGWDEFWNKLVKENILTLPDCHCLKEYFSVKDGVGYVVEINLNGAYRFYHYSTPQSHQEILEPKQMMKIICLIFPEECEPGRGEANCARQHKQ